MPPSRANDHPIALCVATTLTLVAACASSPAGPATVPSSGQQVAEHHPDTKAEPGNCKYFNYYHDESKNEAGAGKCTTECDCDGMRACTGGACQGDPRPDIDCDSPNHRWNEGWNPQGNAKCTTDCDCDGRRTCVWPPIRQRSSVSSGSCEGVAR
jgi:hypothetical protein